jgi:hypothetical protein
LAVVLLGTSPISRVEAYVRAYSSDATGNRPLAWRSGCIFLTPDARGTSFIPAGPNDEFAALNRAIAAWQGASDQCSYLQFVQETPGMLEAGRDGTNVILYRESVWGRPSVNGVPAMTYDSAAAALTVVNYALPQDGDTTLAILDADIEINAVDFRVSVHGVTTQNTPGDPRKLSEIQNTLTHELGHLIGLDHTCFQPVQGAQRPVDENGQPVPNCSPEGALSSAVRDATMYNFAGNGETKKESLEQDDANGLCGIYPRSANPNTCETPNLNDDDGGCSTARAGQSRWSGWAWLLWAVGLLLVGAGLGRTTQTRSRSAPLRGPACSRGRRP